MTYINLSWILYFLFWVISLKRQGFHAYYCSFLFIILFIFFYIISFKDNMFHMSPGSYASQDLCNICIFIYRLFYLFICGKTCIKATNFYSIKLSDFEFVFS